MLPTKHATRGLVIVKRTLSLSLAWIASVGVLAVSPVMPAQVPISSQTIQSPALIVVGFLGGFVREDDDRHLEVQMIHRIAQTNTNGLRAVTVENRGRGREKAHQEIVRWLDTNGDGQLSDREKQNARIILLGHSWGGSAVIQFANELKKSGIPVLMTIQLDSINKGPGDDCVIPSNVEQAVNFYQTRGLLHGCQALHPVDASRTRIVGNYRFEYAELPAGCRSYSWFNRHVLGAHNSMDCDPQVWGLVEEQIRSQLRAVTSGPEVAVRLSSTR